MDKDILHPDPLPEQDEQPAQAPAEPLSEQQCWQLLGQSRFGRLGTRDGDEIEITPVNFIADEGKLYFRSARGSKLLRLSLYSQVAFEVDHVAGGQAWSVIVRGHARTLTDPKDLERFERLDLRPWLDTVKLEVVEIDPYKVTGRRFSLQG
ncbi:pyridoxamine 5'-phosphate oxidase family protein [Kocuria palustris]|uniref:pyridoxamine 5'-phosphate oxidase family protein n=1 Tax=Kocuria palustris TaxID=71999 RepID=UPI0021A94E21|nr:pyridoxamine 5'-phosphate oxidase family protein [Kocuria palustris]MCT1834255.1 pyridoxamine 5'-phosphate oxidase family protein [Kocuria palustris]